MALSLSQKISRYGTLLTVLLFATSVAAQQSPAPDAKKPVARVAKSTSAAAPSQGSQKLDVAGAQAAIESAVKLLAAGKTEPAVASLSTVIASGNLPAAVMARALYLRGSAYRQQTKPGLAIADLTSALWLKGGLNEADRADATHQRSAAYAEAGLSEQGQALAAGNKSRHATTAADAPSPAPAASSGGLFGSLFAGWGATPAKPDADKPSGAPAKVAKPIEPATASWSSATKTAAPVAAQPVAAASTTPSISIARTPHPQDHAHASASHTSARVGLVKTQAQAEAIVAKLKEQYGAALGNHTAKIGQASFGNMGSFFEVAVGPFPSMAEAQGLCGKLKGSGLDCVPVTH